MGFLPSQACYSAVISQKHSQNWVFWGTLIMFFLPSSSLQNIKRQEKKNYKHASSVSEPVGSGKFCFQISKPLNSILALSFQLLHLAVGFICYPGLYLGEITPSFL